MVPMITHNPMSSSSLRVSPQRSPHEMELAVRCPRTRAPSCRSGRELWRLCRAGTLRYATARHLTSGRAANRRMSDTVEHLRRLAHSESGRHVVRRIKYGCGPVGALRQLRDEYNDMIDATTSSWLDRSSAHVPVWTFLMVLCNTSVFFFMAAEWRVEEQGLGWTAGMGNMYNYLSPTEGTIVFSAPFLIKWGARSLWRIFERREWWRWFSSNVVHTSLRHCMSNMLTFALFGTMLERTYGLRLIAVVWVLSAFSGNMFASTFESPCATLSGASGSVFGVIGFYIADTLVQWRRLRRPMLRAVLILGLLGQFGASVFADAGVSHFSHAGGLVTGLASSVVMLPEIANVWIRRTLPLLCVPLVVVSAIVMPVYVYMEGPGEARACVTNSTGGDPLIRLTALGL
jgi:membrane associated rhomboid family serine protease